MLALIRKHQRSIAGLLLLSSLGVMVGCASTKEPPALVSDPEHKPESTLPWNKQERWELTGGLPSQLGESR
jgi:hypothetical protein